MTLRCFSYGGGTQSTAALVLAATGVIDSDTFLFANTGDDSENPATLSYVREVAMPYAAAQGIALHELAHSGPTLLTHLNKTGSRSIDIPVFMANGAPGNRKCTARWKIQVVGRWLREHGATAADPAIIGMGISRDEAHRARSGFDPRLPRQRRVYPLIDLGMSRQDCINTIVRAGLPVPEKSSCWFCPYARPQRWRQLQTERPELFAQAVELERTLNERRAMLGKDEVYLSSTLIPLAEIGTMVSGQAEFDLGQCESGYCHT